MGPSKKKREDAQDERRQLSAANLLRAQRALDRAAKAEAKAAKKKSDSQ